MTSAPPKGVTLEARVDAERIRLARIPPDYQSVPGCLIGLLVVGSIWGSMTGAYWAASLPQRWLAVVLAAVFVFGAMGFAPVAALHLLSKLINLRTPPGPVIEVTPTACRVLGQEVRWGEVQAILCTGDVLRFLLDGGGEVAVPLTRQPPERVQWLRAHLAQRLEELAPGTPRSVPPALQAMRAKVLPAESDGER